MSTIRPIKLGGPSSSSFDNNINNSVGRNTYFGNNNALQSRNAPTFILAGEEENNDPNINGGGGGGLQQRDVSFDYGGGNMNFNNDLSLVVRRGGAASSRPGSSNPTSRTNSRGAAGEGGGGGRGSRGGGGRKSSSANSRGGGNRRRPTFDDEDDAAGGFGIDPSRNNRNNFTNYYQQPQAVGEFAPRLTVTARGNQQQQQGSYYGGNAAAALYGNNRNNFDFTAGGDQIQQYQAPQQLQALPSNNNNNNNGTLLPAASPRGQSSSAPGRRLTSPTGLASPQQQQQQQNTNNNNKLVTFNNNNNNNANNQMLEKEIIRLRYNLILAHKKLQANKIDVPKQSEMNMPHVKGLPLQPLAKAGHVGTSRLYEGYLEVLEGVDIAVPIENATSSIFGGPEWKRRYVVVNEGGVCTYKSEEDVRKYAGQKGLKGSVMFQFVSAFVPSFGPAGRELSKWEPPHPLATDTERYRYFGFVRDAGTLMLFRTEQTTDWHVWSHAFGRAINPTLYAQTFPDIVAADPDPQIDDLTKLSEEERKKYEDIEKEEEEKKKKQKQQEEEDEAKRRSNNEESSNAVDDLSWLNDEAKRKKKLEDAIAVITAATSSTPSSQQQQQNPSSPIKLTAENLNIDANLKAKLEALLSPSSGRNNNNNNNSNNDNSTTPVPQPPPGRPAPPPANEKIETQSTGCDPIFPTPKMVAAGVQIEIKEVDTKIAGIQTDAWLPDQSIVDPVEVENQWAAHVEDLHQKYGEHTSKLEHNLQLARSEVVQLSSALELMRNTSSSAVVGNGGGQQQISLPRQKNLVGDNDDNEEQNTNLSPISHHNHQQQIVGGTKRSVSRHHQNTIVLAADGTSSSTIQQQCQNCYRLEEELTSVEEERDSLVRVLAQRHEDYTKGISRLCDQVLDDIDAVHAHMRDQEIVKKKKTSSNTRRNHQYDEEYSYSDSDDQQDTDVYRDDDNDQQQQLPLSREHQILLHQMQEVGKIAPPFISLQLFDESANSNLHSSSRGIGKVGVRAAFDSRLCVVDSVNPGRETCTWTARDTKTGKNLCSLKLKVENGASLFVQ